MTFVTTSLAIAGLAAISVPILIHLLSRQRRRPIEWAAMQFLVEAFRKKRRRLRVQQILLLAVRCLIVFLLGAALARPILQHTGLLDTGSGRVVYFLLDNGLASGLTDENGTTALHHQISQAKAIIEELDPGDRVGVITAARPADSALMPPTSDLRAASALLHDLESLDSPTDLSGALMLLHTALDRTDDDGNVRQFVYLLSELRAGSAALDTQLPTALRDLDQHVTLIASPPAQMPVVNVTISAIEPVRNVVLPGMADGSGQVTIRLQRTGGALDADVSRVRLSGDGIAPLEPRVVQWDPGQSQASVDFLLNFATTGDQQIALTAAIDDDALNADNTRHAVLDLRNRIRIVSLERRGFGFEPRLDRLSAAQWIRRALEPREGGPLQFVSVEPAALSVGDLRTADVVVATRPDLLGEDGWKLLRQYVDRGGLLLVTPPAQLNVHQWTDRFVKALELPWRIGLEVLEREGGVFLTDEQPRTELLRLIASDLDELSRPVFASRLLPMDMQQTQATELLMLSDGTPLVLAGTPRSVENNVNESRGLVVFMTAAPELAWTNLPSKPLMVPLLHELVRQGLSSIRANQRITAGEQPALFAHRAASDLVSSDGRRIAVTDGRPHDALTRAGLYEVHDAAANTLTTLAVNIAPASASSDTQPAAAVDAWLGGSGQWTLFDMDDPAALLRNVDSRSPLAGILLLIVIALVLLETLLARWFSYSYEGEGAVTSGGLRPTIHHSAAGGAT